MSSQSAVQQAGETLWRVEDVPAYAVVAGNPARPVRMRFDEGTVRRLLEIRWWDWDIAKITRSIPAICGTSIEELEAAR
jgi:virginiamycin A acetyltransferase